MNKEIKEMLHKGIDNDEVECMDGDKDFAVKRIFLEKIYNVGFEEGKSHPSLPQDGGQE